MKILRLAALATLALLLSSCATLFGDNNRQVAVNSNPQGAEIYLNNQYIGVTPSTVTLNNIWNTNAIEFRKKGYTPIHQNIDSKFQPVGLWNILFWPGFIIDAISGDMMKIPPGSNNVTANFPLKNA